MKIDEIELKPCPFCKSNDLRIVKNVNNIDGKIIFTDSHVECVDCGADGPKIYCVDDVIKAWNNR